MEMVGTADAAGGVGTRGNQRRDECDVPAHLRFLCLRTFADRFDDDSKHFRVYCE
jgi:hypothetical protein